MSFVKDLELEVENFKREYEKFERGNKSAGTRARKILQDIKKTCQEIRVSIQGAKKEEEKAGLHQPIDLVWTRYTPMKPFFRHFFKKMSAFCKKRLTKDVFRGIFPFEFCICRFGRCIGFKSKVFYDWRNVAV